MPEYLCVEAYMKCPDEVLFPLLDQFRYLLGDLGYTDSTVATRLAGIAWEPDGGGFGVSLDPAQVLRKVLVNAQPVLALPIVSGWTQQSIPSLQEPWVSCTLAFETQTSRQNFDMVGSFDLEYAQKHTYQPGVGRAMWFVMSLFAARFPQSLIYFTNEAQTGTYWEDLLASQEEIWAFEAALIPHSFSERFTPIPDEFARILVPEGAGFASTVRWKTLPWEE